ncbi:MAG: SCO family protein [Pseudomonadota bacterium]
MMGTLAARFGAPLLVLIFGLLAGGALAWWSAPTSLDGDTFTKASKAQTPRVVAFAPAKDNTPGFPSPKSGDFSLIDQNGEPRSSKDPDGRYQLVFFGYAKCKAICSVALPNMAQATDLLTGLGHTVTPVLVTVDPKRDTVAALKTAAPKMHPRMMGLTGTVPNLEAAYDAFGITKTFVFDHPEEGAVYTHGSMIYLLGPDGGFKTLFPPITNPVRIAELVAAYIAESAG